MAIRRTDFFQDVYSVVQHVPPGRVTTYGAIAQFLGSRMSAQMVGIALNALPLVARDTVPAHRVVNRQGLLTGAAHFGTPTRMAELLAAEGVQVIENQVQDFDARYWDPNREIASTF